MPPRFCPQKRRRARVYNIGNLLKWWGTKTTPSITAKACRQYAGTKTPAAAGADLKVLKAAVLYWNQEYGPLGSVPTYWLPPAAEPRERWLTRRRQRGYCGRRDAASTFAASSYFRYTPRHALA